MELKKRITVLSPSFALTSILSLAPAITSIAAAFPETSTSMVQTLTTLPSLIAIPVILISGRLSTITTKKRIVTASLVLMLLGGLAPLLFHSRFSQLMAAAVVFGLGYGGISPLTTALIHEHYSQGEQPMMLGLQSAVIGVGGALFSFLGGRLAAVRWWYAYFAFLLFLPILLLVLMLPRGETAPRVAGRTGGISPRLLLYGGQAIVYCVFLYIFQTSIALLVAGRGLGGAEVSGRILSVQSVFSILSGVLGGVILTRLGRYSLPVIFGGTAASLLIAYLAGGVLPLFVSAAVLGFFFALRMPAGYLKATQSVPPAAATMAIAFYCSASQAGQFLSPAVVGWLSGLLGIGLERRFLLGGVCLTALAVLSAVWEWRQAAEVRRSPASGPLT